MTLLYRLYCCVTLHPGNSSSALLQRIAEREGRQEQAMASLLDHARGLHAEAQELQTSLDTEQR